MLKLVKGAKVVVFETYTQLTKKIRILRKLKKKIKILKVSIMPFWIVVGLMSQPP